MSKYLHVTVDMEGIATLLLDDPDRSANVVSPMWLDAMTHVFEELKATPAVRGIILTSAKAGFLAGFDLKFVLDHANGMWEADAFELSQRGTRLHRLIETCGKPVVAAINGFALGGGYELALACHRRILSDDPKAIIGLPEVTLGLLPGSGGTQRLPRMIGIERAIEVLLEGKSFVPKEALALGLVDTLAPKDELIPAAKAWLRDSPEAVRSWDKNVPAAAKAASPLNPKDAELFIATTARLRARYGRNYPAPIAILACVFEGIQVPFSSGLRIESRHFARLFTGAVSRNLIRTTFVKKGLARRPMHSGIVVGRTNIAKIGVLGAGMMGAGIAFVAAQAGIDVMLLDTTIETARKGKAVSEKILRKDIEQGRKTHNEADAILAHIVPTVDFADMVGTDLVIEAVFENAAIKAEVTRKAQVKIGSETFFASNTSTIPISKLAAAFERPADFIGLHFFSPVDRMPLIEVIKGEKTSAETLSRALIFASQIRKTPIVVNDSRGFYTSRVFQTFIHEGMALLLDGVMPALIENAAKAAGFPLGPLALLDEVSLDLPLTVVQQAERDDPEFRRPASTAVLEKMIDVLGRSGRKGGGGFYEYKTGATRKLWSGLGIAFEQSRKQPDVEDVIRRLMYVQALESVRCLEEGVLSQPSDADVGAILGWSFPAWTGGTLSLIGTIGLGRFVAECDRLAEAHGARFSPTASLHDAAARRQRYYY